MLYLLNFNLKGTENDFKQKAQLYAESLINGDYDTAISVSYYLPERKFMLEQLREMWETEGTAMIDYKIYAINRLSDELYQLDGVFIYEGGYQDAFIPFYFFMDNEWHMALNSYQIPSKYLENVEYKTIENAIDPDGLTIF